MVVLISLHLHHRIFSSSGDQLPGHIGPTDGAPGVLGGVEEGGHTLLKRHLPPISWKRKHWHNSEALLSPCFLLRTCPAPWTRVAEQKLGEHGDVGAAEGHLAENIIRYAEVIIGLQSWQSAIIIPAKEEVYGAKSLRTGNRRQYPLQHKGWPVQNVAIGNNATLVQALHQLHPMHGEQQGDEGADVARVDHPLLLQVLNSESCNGVTACLSRDGVLTMEIQCLEIPV